MLTAEQATERQKYLCSSEAAAVMGLDPDTSAADVYLIKVGAVEPFAGNEHTKRGNRLEPVILQYLTDELYGDLNGDVGWINDQMLVADDGLRAANYDAIHFDHSVNYEAKSVGSFEGWGEEGTDEVPDRVLVQASHAMHVAGPQCRLTHVGVFGPGYRSFVFKHYVIERDDALCDQVAEQARAFMREHVIPRVPPSDFRPSLDVIKRVRRQPNKVVEVDDATARMLTDMYHHRNVAKQAERDAKRLESFVLAKIGDAEGFSLPDGRAYTYLEQSRAGYSVGPCKYRTIKPAKREERR